MNAAVTESTGPPESGAPGPDLGGPVSPETDAEAPTGVFRQAPLDRAMGTYLPATIAFRLINFGRIILLTWWMTTQQFGLLNIILLVINVMIPMCSLGLNEAVTRYVPQHEHRGSLRQFLRRSFRLCFAVVLVSMALIVVCSPVLGDFFFAHVVADPAARETFSADAVQLAQLSAVVIGLCIVYFYILAVLKGLRMFTALAVMEIAHGVLFLVASVLAHQTGHLSAFTLTLLYGMSVAIPILVFGLGLRGAILRWNGQHGDLQGEALTAKLLRFSIWAMLAGITWQVLIWYPKWFLAKVHGHEAVAVYAVARQIGQFILIGAMAVAAVVTTTVTKTWESRGRQEAERQLSLAFRGTGLGLLVLCAVIALAKDLIFLVFKVEYAAAAAILPLQLLFFLIAAFLAFLPIHFQLIERTRHIFWPWAVGVSANVLVALWLVGPNLERVQELAIWQRLAPVATKVFAAGFSDPRGLDSAAWSGVIAITAALMMCVALIRADHCRLHRGAYIVMFSSALLAAHWWILVSGTIILLVLAWRTAWIFTPDERDRLADCVGGALRHVPGSGALWRAYDGGR